MNKWIFTICLFMSGYMVSGQTDFSQHEDETGYGIEMTPQEAPSVTSNQNENALEGRKEAIQPVSQKQKKSVRKNLRSAIKQLHRTQKTGGDFDSNDLLLLFLAVILAVLILAVLPDLLWLLIVVLLAYLIYVFLLQ